MPVRALPGALRLAVVKAMESQTPAKTFGETMLEQAESKGCSPCQAAWRRFLQLSRSTSPGRGRWGIRMPS